MQLRDINIHGFSFYSMLANEDKLNNMINRSQETAHHYHQYLATCEIKSNLSAINKTINGVRCST